MSGRSQLETNSYDQLHAVFTRDMAAHNGYVLASADKGELVVLLGDAEITFVFSAGGDSLVQIKVEP